MWYHCLRSKLTMNEIEQTILEKASTNSLDNLTLREIGETISRKQLHPQTVKYYLEKLKHKGYISVDFKSKIIRRVKSGQIADSNLIALPILGAANCGEASIIADEYIQGHLRISSKLLDKSVLARKSNIFIVEASGDSMNMAQIGDDKMPINDGDYVLIDSSNKAPSKNDYVLSIIDGLANIKKFRLDSVNDRILLLSESNKDYPPIIIPNDNSFGYLINGIVLQVIKKVKP